MIAVSILLFIAGGVLGYVLCQLSAARKLQVVSLETERLKVELAMLQQQKSESAQQLQTQQTKLDSVMAELGVSGVDGILLDLGVSSYQIDERTRGFTYMQNGPLDMRMDKSQELTAEYVVNNYKEEELARIIYEYGEEKFSRQIAKNIALNYNIFLVVQYKNLRARSS